jgi:hypothetical protein
MASKNAEKGTFSRWAAILAISSVGNIS